MSYGVGYRLGSDPVLLWLWHRPAATAPIRPLAWQSPYASGTALKSGKKKNNNKKKLFPPSLAPGNHHSTFKLHL